jgi:hypothetical protein
MIHNEYIEITHGSFGGHLSKPNRLYPADGIVIHNMSKNKEKIRAIDKYDYNN